MTLTILLGALIVFVYSINSLSETLATLSLNKLKEKITFATKTTRKSLLFGFISTLIIQSSSAVIILTISLINAGLLNFNNSIGILLGSNIATTITSFIVGLNIESISSLIMLIGIILLIFKNKYGKPLFYIGLIFYSFLLISFSVNQIKDNQLFLFCISTFSSSFIMSLITGTLITVVLQSSSVFVAILQILAISGLLTIEQAIPFIFGANIGTTLDSFYGVFGDKKDAKKLASFNLMFNVLAVIIFSILINPFKYIIRLIINSLNQNISINIAIINIVFNTLSVLIVLPFVNKIKKIYDKW